MSNNVVRRAGSAEVRSRSRPTAGLTGAIAALAALAALAASAGLAATAAGSQPSVESASARPVVVGSKAFTESVILGEIVTRTLERKGVSAEHRRSLGGSRVLFDALRAGEIDLYPEYTGTLDQELLGLPQSQGGGSTAAARDAALRTRGLTIAARFGFEDR